MKAKFAGPAMTYALLAATLAAAQNDPKAAVSEQDIPGPPPVAAAAAPTRPAEMPPKPPTITCSGGQLTIVGENSTMGSILTAVQQCIGVRFDIPADTQERRTFVHLGPGLIRVVLHSLLESTDDNYVIEPSATDPDAIRSVILISRAKPEEREDPSPGNRTLTAARRAWIEERNRTRAPVAPSEDSSSVAENDSAEDQSATDTPGAEKAAPTAPAGTDTADAAPSVVAQPPPVSSAPGPEASSDNGANNAGGQLQNQITNMQQLFEQRQQMMQNQSKPPAPLPPQ